MPARRDIMTGRLNFLEREWGGLEPFDIPFPRLIRQRGIYSRLETDHYHYVHVGGENYHTPFSSWNLCRGQEFDAYGGKIDSPQNRSIWGNGTSNTQKTGQLLETKRISLLPELLPVR